MSSYVCLLSTHCLSCLRALLHTCILIMIARVLARARVHVILCLLALRTLFVLLARLAVHMCVLLARLLVHACVVL